MKAKKQGGKKEQNCVGCEFHSRCAGIVFGHIGAPGHANKITSGIEKKEWCENWREFDRQRRTI